jgi:A/G-specific adenine glycosylase
MENKFPEKLFCNKLIDWYIKHKRDLPWRETGEAYKIWLSEIILQQTRVQQGLQYYNVFTRRFPDVKSLAAADEKEVLLLWEGLGYYSRARNLLKTARIILSDYKGQFPDQYEALLTLPGIGPYTAAAIASFAFGREYPAIDSNVKRLFSRILALEEPQDSTSFMTKANDFGAGLIRTCDAAIFNQATMELGAMVCTPQKPSCALCPVQDLCLGHKMGIETLLPNKKRGNNVQKRFFNYIVAFHKKDNQQQKIFIRQRDERDIWAHLFEFPLIETKASLIEADVAQLISKESGLHADEFRIIKISPIQKHRLSHQLLHLRFIHIIIGGNDIPDCLSTYELQTPMQLTEYAFPVVLKKYINAHLFLE